MAGAVGLRAIKIDADAEKFHWLDMRRQFEWNLSVSMGIEVRRVTKRPPDLYGQVHLLDMDSTLGTTIDHSLTTWRTFEDAANGIRIRLTESGIDEIGWYADVLIES